MGNTGLLGPGLNPLLKLWCLEGNKILTRAPIILERYHIATVLLVSYSVGQKPPPHAPTPIQYKLSFAQSTTANPKGFDENGQPIPPSNWVSKGWFIYYLTRLRWAGG